MFVVAGPPHDTGYQPSYWRLGFTLMETTAAMTSDRHRAIGSSNNTMRLAPFLIALVSFSMFNEAVAARAGDIRFTNGPVAHCIVKGVITAHLQAPESSTVDIVTGARKAAAGVIETGALADLKRQAAALGANRIVVRDINSEGTIAFGPRIGKAVGWDASKIVAEALRC